MSSDTEETQQVALALIDESENPASKNANQKLKTCSSRTTECIEDCIVGYAAPVLLIILLVFLLILLFVAKRKYNLNCVHTKRASCHGVLWFLAE